MTNDVHAWYISDLVILFREAMRDALSEAKRLESTDASNATFQEGRAMAYAEVLSFMQTQADAFMLPREELRLDGFDPMQDLMAK